MAAVLISTIASFAAALALAVSYSPMTPYDEQAHFDYVARLATERQLFPVGEMYAQVTLDEIACRSIGVDDAGRERTTCVPPLTKGDLPFEGVNYVAGYSPFFYGVTALLAEPLSAVGGISLFLAARLVCAMWFAIGAGVLAAALIRVGARPTLAAGATVLLASTPTFVLQGGAVTPDSVSLLAGGGALFLMTLRTRWRHRLLWATLFAVCIALVKSSFVPIATFAILMAVVYPMAGSNGRARWTELGWRRLGAGVGLAALPAVATGLNSLWRSASLAPGGTADGGMSSILRTSSSIGTEIVMAALQLLQPLAAVGYINPAPWVLVAVAVQTVLLGGAVLIALQPQFDVRGLTRTTAFSAVGSWCLAVIFLPVTFFVLFHVQGTQGRYASPLLPLFLAAVVLSVANSRRAGWITASAAVLGWLLAMTSVTSV